MEHLCLMIPKSGAKFEEKLIFCFKNDKQKMYELQTYRGVISNDTEE